MPESKSGRNPDGNDVIGLVLALAAASGLGLAVAFSRFAYEGGTTALTIAATRAVLTVGLLGLWFALRRRSVRMDWGLWLHAVGLGCLVAIMFWGNIAAVQYIPVGLAALLFYTYPPMVALGSALVFRERISRSKAVALGVAFVGLGVMLGVSLGSADGVGMAISICAAAATAVNAMWVARRMRGVDPLLLTFHMAIVAALVLVTLLVYEGGLVMPTTSTGWFGYGATALTQSLSIPLYFVALARIGALKSAMFSNIQPVVSIVAAWLLFGDLLALDQIVGGAMVLGAIVAVQRLDARPEGRAAARR
jgi:drug/metabolite transporter (DMT)-like permease